MVRRLAGSPCRSLRRITAIAVLNGRFAGVQKNESLKSRIVSLVVPGARALFDARSAFVASFSAQVATFCTVAVKVVKSCR